MDTESRVCPFGMVRIRINDPRSVRSWCLKGSDESTLGKGSTVPLMLDCSQPLCISTHAKEKRVQSMQGWGWECEQSEPNEE